MKINPWISRLFLSMAALFLTATAGAVQPMWTIVPLTPTTISPPLVGSALVQYTVTNLNKNTQTLAMREIPGITQVTTSGNCADPFVLTQNQSCILTLSVPAGNTHIAGGPVVCKYHDNVNNGQAVGQCYSPATSNGLDITPYVGLAVDNSVFTMLPDIAHDTLYIGGAFTHIGPPTGGGTPVFASTGLAVATYPKVDGTVIASVADGYGGWYIGGAFISVGSLPIRNLAHITSAGTVDPSFIPNPDDQVFTLALRNGILYVGGNFLNIGGQPRSMLAALDSAGFATTWTANADKRVLALTIGSDGTVYAGGVFTVIGGQSRSNIAAIDSLGNVTAWNPSVTNATPGTSFVNTLALSPNGNTMYVGGSFASVNTVAPLSSTVRNRLAAFSTLNGMVSSWNPSVNNTVNSLAVSSDSSTIYAGGTFTKVNTVSPLSITNRNALAAFNNSDGTVNSWDPNATANSTVNVIVLSNDGTTIYAGGGFQAMGPTNTSAGFRSGLASIDSTTGALNAWDPHPSGGVNALALSNDGSLVYVGGGFSLLGGSLRNHLAALKISTGELLAWNPSVGNAGVANQYSVIVYSLAMKDSTIYVGGSFLNVNGTARNRLAAIGSDGTLVSSWSPSANSDVRALLFVHDTTVGDRLYAGGGFSAISGTARNLIAAIDPLSGALVSTWDPNITKSPNDNQPIVVALALGDVGLYVGGNFNTINTGTPTAALRNNLAAVNVASGQVLTWNPNVNNIGPRGTNAVSFNGVRALNVNNGIVYAVGDFNAVNGTTPNRNLAAAFDASGVVTGFNPHLTSGATARSIAIEGDTIYIGGNYTSVNGVARNLLAAFNTDGAMLTWDPQLVGQIVLGVLPVSSTRLFAGGAFTDVSTSLLFFGITNIGI